LDQSAKRDTKGDGLRDDAGFSPEQLAAESETEYQKKSGENPKYESPAEMFRHNAGNHLPQHKTENLPGEKSSDHSLALMIIHLVADPGHGQRNYRRCGGPRQNARQRQQVERVCEGA